tara:strand:+ start:1996 stop:2334 length:339 start_codon:yes stop_codon:yes gene_type:complete
MIKGNHGNLINTTFQTTSLNSLEVKLNDRENDRIEIVGGVDSVDRTYVRVRVELSYNHGADFFDYEILNLNNLGNLRYDINTHATHLRLHLLIENLPALHDGVNPVFSVYWK